MLNGILMGILFLAACGTVEQARDRDSRDATIRCRVIYLNGSPVEGVWVVLAKKPAAPKWFPAVTSRYTHLATQRTNPSGGVVFKDIEIDWRSAALIAQGETQSELRFGTEFITYTSVTLDRLHIDRINEIVVPNDFEPAREEPSIK